MSQTRAIPTADLYPSGTERDQPLCPACRGGRLHPYLIEFTVFPQEHALRARMGGGVGPTVLNAWVAVCRGARDESGTALDPPCGFSVRLETALFDRPR